jgi:purine-nucleoside phosphorylase
MNYNETINFIRENTNFQPKIGIILGSGLGNVIKDMEIECSLPYETIPGFIKPTIEGHSGNLIFGYLEGNPVVAMQGRNHYYEGHTMQEITFPVRIMKLLGIHTLITSNATGGMNERYEIGDIMIVNDHINLMGDSPLIGPNDESFGTRFPDMSKTYNREIIDYALKYALNSDIKVHEGILLALAGPTYETPAEYRFLRIIGADAVGMSTIPEVIVGVHMGLRCFSMSLITDLGIPGKIVEITHEEVQREAEKAAPKMVSIVKEIVSKFA